MTTDFYHSSLEYPLEASARSSKQTSIPLSERLLGLYMSLLNLGTDAVKDSKQVKYTKICNFISMTSFISALGYIPMAIVWGNPIWLAVVTGICLMSMGVLYLNKVGSIHVSRIAYMVAVNILLFLSALVIGPNSNSESFLLIAVLIPFLVFDLSNTKLILVGIMMPLTFLISYQHVSPLFLDYNLTIAHQNLLHTIGMPMEVGLAAAALFQFVYYSRKTELELEASNQLMTVQTTELKRSNADLEQFAYVISHDLKAPVRNISCFMRLLSTKHGVTLDAEASEFVEFALTGSKRMERLIDDVLAYSRIGRNLSAPTPVNINDVINTIRYEIEGKHDMPNAIISIDRELPIVNSVHSSLMYHIFQNLIRNGLKFNKSEYPEVNISWDETEDSYKFSVSDNGIGISQKFAKQVFQMFKRLHAEDVYDGTGIGLAIAKKIVENYNGEIWYESDGEHGTTFCFTIRKF